MNARHQEARLLRRIAYLRTFLRYADQAEIVVVLEEFIADTENQLVSLKPDRRSKATLH